MLSLTSPSPAAGPIRRPLGGGRVGPVRVRGRRRPGRRRAFTLVELVITIGVLGTLAAIAIPRYHSAVLRHRAEMAAQRIVADLELIRRTAIARSETVTVEFSAGKKAYGDDVIGLEVMLADSPYGITGMKVDNDAEGETELQFDALGQASRVGGSTTTLTVLIEVHGITRTVTYSTISRRSTIQ